MRIAIFKLSIISFLLAFGSCGIEELQPKPDYTLAGKQMFDRTETHITMVTDWLDVLLKMNTYIQAPVEDKIKIEDMYFPNYKIRNTDTNTWALIQMSDTVCIIYTDTKPFTTVGANWEIQKNNMLLSCPISCVSENTWALNVSNFKIGNYSYEYYNPYSNNYSNETFTSDSLLFYSDNATPEEFTTNNFEVTGKGEFLLENNHQKIKLSYEINKPLKHISNTSYNMSSGKYFLSAQDLKSSKNGSGSAEFETILGNERKITIEYNGRTQIYPRNN